MLKRLYAVHIAPQSLIITPVRSASSSPTPSIFTPRPLHHLFKTLNTLLPHGQLLPHPCALSHNLTWDAIPEANCSPNDLVVECDTPVAIGVQAPTYRIKISYQSSHSVLAGAHRIWAHVGHSGWKDTADVQMLHTHDGEFRCDFTVPAHRLQSLSQLTVQLAFKGDMGAGPDGGMRWDNNGGTNWSLEFEVSPGRGLVSGPRLGDTRPLVSSLLLRVEALRVGGQLSREQADTLRNLAWSRDFTLLADYDTAQRAHATDEAILQMLLQRCAFLQRPGLHVVHIAAEMAPIAKEQYHSTSLANTTVLLTIHNIAFQGWLTPDYLVTVGLDPANTYTPDKLLDDSRPGFLRNQHDINMLRGGIAYADRVTTVSPTYAREVFDPVFGMGLEGVLAKHQQKFCGVLNGIDHEMWDPARDEVIPARFSAGALEGKAECKRALLQELGLPFNTDIHPGGRPLLCVLTRLTEQKGLPLIEHGIRAAIAAGAQVVLLGSAPEPAVAAKFSAQAESLARGGDARFVLRYDEGLSHRIYAGSDMILIPSIFEPCGLTQLIGLRYGTIPIVRETGGLADTVHDVAHSTAPEHQRNGFTFSGREAADVERAVCRAIDAYNQGWNWWRECLVPRAMNQDWSWSRSAQDYLDLYRCMGR